MKPEHTDILDKEELAARERYQQAMVDADIEGMADDPEYEGLVRQMDDEQLSVEARIERLKSLAQKRQAALTAAE